MNKRRPVVVLSSVSNRLCVVVSLSTKKPYPLEKWHHLLRTPEPLPTPFDAQEHWVKGDMVNTVSFDRLDLPYLGKDVNGKRIYDIKTVNHEDFWSIAACVAFGLFRIEIDKTVADKHN